MEIFDLVGLGIGPFNLSLAALSEPTKLKTIFFDEKKEFSWHPGFMLPNGLLQVSPLKDCVTLADPTSKFSFLNYLSQHRRLYSFVNKNSALTTRKEFTHYYQWVAKQLSNLKFDEKVIDVSAHLDGYCITTSKRQYFAKAIVIGVGITPKVPDCAKPWLGKSLYHVADYLHQDDFKAGEKVMVVGGGQSGAEAIEHMLSNPSIGKVTWVTSRANLFAMDDNAFVNEAFSPTYSCNFHKLPIHKRRAIVEAEKLTSDGISADLSARIYDRLYEQTINSSLNKMIDILPSVVMNTITPQEKKWKVDLKSLVTNQSRKILVNRIILATGFQPKVLPFIEQLFQFACMDDGLPVVNGDYSIQFNRKMPGSVFLQNQSRVQHGLQSVNLSLVAYRNSRIINALLGQEYYSNTPDQQVFSALEELTEVGEIERDLAPKSITRNIAVTFR